MAFGSRIKNDIVIIVSEPDCQRGEWEAERGKGRGIVVCSNGGFPPPVSQTHHVTHPEKERVQELRGRLERLRGDWLHRPASQSISLCFLFFYEFSHSSATNQTILLCAQYLWGLGCKLDKTNN